MSKVFIIQDNPYAPKNFIPATEFGELSVIFDKHVPTTSIVRFIPLLKDKLKDITKHDYIVPTGHPALIAIAGAISYETIGEINLLIWDHQSNIYYPIKTGEQGDYSQSEIIKAGQEAL